MAKFYAAAAGYEGTNKSEATRLGSRAVETVAASWNGAVMTTVYEAEKGEIWCEVRLVPWHGQGVDKLLYRGPVNEAGE